MENKDKPAYHFETNSPHKPGEIVYHGLTKRELLAGMAMQGTLSSSTDNQWYDKVLLAKKSIEYADELLKQLDK